jgi:hypothetical protein
MFLKTPEDYWLLLEGPSVWSKAELASSGELSSNWEADSVASNFYSGYLLKHLFSIITYLYPVWYFPTLIKNYLIQVQTINSHNGGGGVQLGPLGTAATDWPIVPAPGYYDDGEFGGIKIRRGNRSAPVPLCPPQIQLDQTQVWTRAAAVASQRPTAWAMARPVQTLCSLSDFIKIIAFSLIGSLMKKPTRWSPRQSCPQTVVRCVAVVEMSSIFSFQCS